MIVQCPSCSTGYHWVPGPTANVRLRCSRCLIAFPCPTHRRAYVLGPEEVAVLPRPASILEPLEPQAPARSRAAAPLPVPLQPLAPVPPEPTEEEADAAVPEPVALAPETPVPSRPAGAVRAAWEVEPRARSLAAAFLPLAFAAAGAAGAWLAAPVLGDAASPAGAWIASIPIPAVLGPLQPWMFAAAGAVAGLLLGGVVVLGWRTARR